MKISRLETHDRLQFLKQNQSANVFQGAEDCLKKNKDSLAIQEKSSYVYLWAHPRTANDGINKRLLWQPRLTKPKVSDNSYLFRAQSHTDIIEVCWLLPDKLTWDQYIKGNVVEDELISWSINMFKHHRDILNAPHPEDYSNQAVRNILVGIWKNSNLKKYKMI